MYNNSGAQGLLVLQKVPYSVIDIERARERERGKDCERRRRVSASSGREAREEGSERTSSAPGYFFMSRASFISDHSPSASSTGQHLTKWARIRAGRRFSAPPPPPAPPPAAASSSYLAVHAPAPGYPACTPRHSCCRHHSREPSGSDGETTRSPGRKWTNVAVVAAANESIDELVTGAMLEPESENVTTHWARDAVKNE